MNARSTVTTGQRELSSNSPKNGPIGTDPEGSTPSILIHVVKRGPDSSEPPLKLQNVSLGKRLEGFGAQAKYARQFGEWLEARSADCPDRVQAAEMLHRSEYLKGCASVLMFRQYHTHPEKPVKLASAVFCGQTKLCAFCASRRAARQAGALATKITARMQEAPNLVPYFVTLTARSQTECRPMIDHVWRGWSTFRSRMNLAKRGKCDTIASAWDGGFVSMEVKRGTGGHGWHAHLHGLILTTHDANARWVPLRERFGREWSSMIGQQTANVYYKPVQIRNDEALVNAVVESCKYTVKFEADKPADTWDAHRALSTDPVIKQKRVQCVRSFGSLRGKLPESLTDDLNEFDHLPYIELAYRFLYGSYVSQNISRETDFDDFNEGNDQ